MTHEEEMALREYAAGRACTQSVINALGPMSLWSKSGFDAAIRKAVEAEREACAKVCEEWLGPTKDREIHIATAIRARGQA